MPRTGFCAPPLYLQIVAQSRALRQPTTKQGQVLSPPGLRSYILFFTWFRRKKNLNRNRPIMPKI